MNPRQFFQLFLSCTLCWTVLAQGCPNGWNEYSGNCYKFFPEAKPFSEAEFYCKQYGAHITSASSVGENKYVADLYKGKASLVWIGASRVGEGKPWTWADSSPFQFIAWNAGEPNNLGGNENCVHQGYGGVYNWGDIACANPYPYVCKVSPGIYKPVTDLSSTCFDSVRNCWLKTSECRTEEAYAGNVAKTIDGKDCQVWNVQEPHTHDKGLQYGNTNVCRNPDNDLGPWCYTTDPNKRWNYCFNICDPQVIPPPPPATCPTGWMLFNGNCYRLFNTRVGFWASERLCQSYNGHLISIHSIEEATFALGLSGGANTWIGANAQTGNYIWTDGTPFDYNGWTTGEPNGVGSIKCGYFWGKTTWEDWDCSDSYRYPTGSAICKVSPSQYKEKCPNEWYLYGNSCYQHFPGPVNFDVAEANCQTLGSHLVSIHSADENKFLLSINDPGFASWIGGNDKAQEGKYVWTDGSVFNYTNFWTAGGEPNGGTNENCFFMWGLGAQPDTWGDYPCTVVGHGHYICKKQAI